MGTPVLVHLQNALGRQWCNNLIPIVYQMRSNVDLSFAVCEECIDRRIYDILQRVNRAEKL